MSRVEKVLRLFGSGVLMRPGADILNSMDLFRALARLAGCTGIKGGKGVDEFMKLIGHARHYVFVLVDGLGMNVLQTLPEESMLRRKFSRELRAIFPPTTAAVLTSLATAQWPCFHGMPGWWVYEGGIGQTAISLPFTERFSKRPLEDFGLEVEDVYPAPSVWSRATRRVTNLVRNNIAQSTYTRYSTGGSTRIGYQGISHALKVILDIVLNSTDETFTYLYLPQYDASCHEKGTIHPDSLRLLRAIDVLLGRFRENVGDNARIVISADHGLSDTPPDERLVLRDGDELLEHLIVPPTVEARIPAFHVKSGREQAFLKHFEARLGEHFVLITPDEAESLGLFGPGSLSTLLRERLGSFIGVSTGRAALYYRSAESLEPPHAAAHAGLSPREMRVPLIIA